MKFLEAKIQQEIVMWTNNNYGLNFHNPKILIFSVPNENKDLKEAIRKKAIGLKKGVSDLILVAPGRVVFVEVKTDIGVQSANQKAFEQDVNALGFDYWIVRSLEDFKNMFYNIYPKVGSNDF